ncbi:MAG: KpsF/GutQ family sugar-phosphate isomerase [Alistipes sp.]|nr:KpsF/GutQ family sugar-phosphate isomerase [Alistipes sp.]
MNRLQKESILEIAHEVLQTEAEAIMHVKDSLNGDFIRAVEMILDCTGKIILTGMGKSGIIAKKIAATLSSTGTPSFFLDSGEAFHGDLGMISKDDIIIAISYSGETDEVLKIVPFIHENGNRLISITGNNKSALAKHSDINLDVEVEREACILHLAPTSSTTAQLALGDALACALMKMRNFSAQDFARLHPGGSLGRRLLMKVGQVMRRHDLPIVSEEATAAEIIHAISRGGLGLIVVQRGEEILGIITDGDIRRAMESRQAAFFDIHPMDIATREPKCIHPESKLIEAEKSMTQHKVNSLLVTNDDNHLVGVIQIYDIKL